MKSGSGLRDVLFLAYHFPPLGGAGVQRSLKFVRYLPEFGFRPVVVTGPDRGSASWPPQDRELTRELRPDTPLYRVAAPLDPRPGARLARIRSRLFTSTTRFGHLWVEGCTAMGLRAARETSPALVFATMSPFQSARAAARLASALSVPWVADLRDPWALDEMFVYPTALHRWLAVRRMREELSGASAIVMNTPEATRAMRELLSEEAASLVATIPNGYDAEDFRDPPPARPSGVFRIVHTGHLHAELGLRHRRTQRIRRLLGGERVAVEVLSRSHYYLLQALRRWREADPTITGRVLLVLAGDASQLDRELVRRSGVADLVEMTGYLDHRASVALLRSADLLFLPMQGLPPGERSRIVPGKTYEYLAAGRPILAAVPEGDARDLVLRSGMGDVCAPDDVATMVEIMRRRHREAEEGIEPQPSSATLLHRFERRQLTRELAAVFSKVLADRAPESA